MDADFIRLQSERRDLGSVRSRTLDISFSLYEVYYQPSLYYVTLFFKLKVGCKQVSIVCVTTMALTAGNFTARACEIRKTQE